MKPFGRKVSIVLSDSAYGYGLFAILKNYHKILGAKEMNVVRLVGTG